MAFSHAYLIELSQCWRRQPEKLAERSKLWPPVLSWSWFLDPARVEPFGRREALEILSSATMHAFKTKAPLWDGLKAIELYRAFQQGGSYEVFVRLGAALDQHDEAVCELLGVDMIDAPQPPKTARLVRMADRRAALEPARLRRHEEKAAADARSLTELESAEDAAAAELEAERAELGAQYADTDQAEQPKE